MTRDGAALSDVVAPPAPPADTKEKILRAAEGLFARDGIHRVRVREINELAGQRNSSALHYHFGSRERLVEAILLSHQQAIDDEFEARIRELQVGGREATIREIVEAMVRPLTAKLDTQSGRDFLRIVPQILETLSENLRRGRVVPSTPASKHILAMLDARMMPLPEAVRRERLVAYTLILTSILAERAHHIETGHPVLLDAEGFIAHLLDTIEGALAAPSTVLRPASGGVTRARKLPRRGRR